MKSLLRHFMDTAIAALLIAAIIYSTMLLALEVVNSSIYRQSRIVSMLVQQDTVGITELLEDSRNIDMVIKFAGALTSAYINFELIPLGEASTFVAVFESLPKGVNIDGFEYRRKDLHIEGTAEDESGYEAFLTELTGQGHFASVTGSCYESTDGRRHFKIICASNATETHLAF